VSGIRVATYSPEDDGKKMTPMSQVGKRHGLVWPMILAFLFAAACSRPAGIPTEGSTQANQTPFQAEGGDSSVLTALPKGSPENGLPFHDPQDLPAGTLLTVRLESGITAGNSINENSFIAILDEPVVIEGNTLIPQGASVAGRIESAGISKVKPGRAYVRLSLESVHVRGLDVPVQTASLFARPTPQSGELIRLEKGRRLTFRLTEPASLNPQRAQASH